LVGVATDAASISSENSSSELVARTSYCCAMSLAVVASMS
jgi:hypothetical protein